MKLFLLLLISFILSLQVSAQTTFTTVADGNWSNTSTWIGGGVPTGSTSADSISIIHNVTVDQNLNFMNAAITIGAGTTLTVAPFINLYKGSSRPFIVNGTLLINGNFRNTSASAYGQGVTGLAGSAITVAGRIETASYLITDGSFTMLPGSRFNSGGNVILKNGMVNNGYINLTSPITLYKNVFNNDTLRITTMTLEDCIFKNDTRAFLNNGTDLFIRDTSTLINTDSSSINSFGRITITQSSNILNEDSARIRITSSFFLWDSSKYTSTTKSEFLCQGTIVVSSASEFNNAALLTNVGGQVNISGKFTNNNDGIVSSNGTFTVLTNGRLNNKATFSSSPGTVRVNAGGLFVNESIGIMQANITYNILGTVDNSGTINGGIITVAAGGILNNLPLASCFTSSTFNISGTVNNNSILSGSALNISTTGVLNNNHLSSYNFANGTATINGNFTRIGTDVLTNVGDVSGTGIFTGNIEPAILYPATNTTTGAFTVNGNYTVTAPNKGLQINVNGKTPGTEYDRLNVNGTLNLAGTLLTTFNYTPAADTVLTIIKSTSLIGTFAQFSPALPAHWSILYNSPATGDVSLVYTLTPTSIRNQERLSGIKIYTGATDLYVKGVKEKFEVLVVSVDGKLVLSERFGVPVNDVSRITFNKAVTPGVYMVKVITAKGVVTEKILMQ